MGTHPCFICPKINFFTCRNHFLLKFYGFKSCKCTRNLLYVVVYLDIQYQEGKILICQSNFLSKEPFFNFFPGMSKLGFTSFIPPRFMCHLVSSDKANKMTGNQQFPYFPVHQLYLLPLVIQCCNKSYDMVSFREFKVLKMWE